MSCTSGFKNSTIHGVFELFSSTSKKQKVTWALILLAASILMTIQISKILLKFESHPKFTSLHLIKIEPWPPEIGLCSKSLIYWDRLWDILTEDELLYLFGYFTDPGDNYRKMTKGLNLEYDIVKKLARSFSLPVEPITLLWPKIKNNFTMMSLRYTLKMANNDGRIVQYNNNLFAKLEHKLPLYETEPCRTMILNMSYHLSEKIRNRARYSDTIEIELFQFQTTERVVDLFNRSFDSHHLNLFSQWVINVAGSLKQMWFTSEYTFHVHAIKRKFITSKIGVCADTWYKTKSECFMKCTEKGQENKLCTWIDKAEMWKSGNTDNNVTCKQYVRR